MVADPLPEQVVPWCSTGGRDNTLKSRSTIANTLAYNRTRLSLRAHKKESYLLTIAPPNCRYYSLLMPARLAAYISTAPLGALIGVRATTA